MSIDLTAKIAEYLQRKREYFVKNHNKLLKLK